MFECKKCHHTGYEEMVFAVSMEPEGPTEILEVECPECDHYWMVEREATLEDFETWVERV